jgi:phosphatidate cytidylyltransferase
MAVIMMSDTGAYFAGRTMGRHKLAPRVSPAKTVEGSIGGLVASVAAAVASKYIFFPELPIPDAIALGAGMGALGQVGDLCESLLKRGSDVKDAASILPGHGGFLDRLDSMLLNAPAFYYYYVYVLAPRI